MGGRYCAINSPLGPRWGHLEPRGEVIAQYRPPMFRYRNELKDQLMKYTDKTIKWFESKHMKSNASKFQAIIMKPSPSIEPIVVGRNRQSVQPSVKLLGVLVDDKLLFQNHISLICLQINTMNMTSKFLSKNCKVRLYNAFIS